MAGQTPNTASITTSPPDTWTAKGYPRLAQWMGAYPEVAIIRRFGTLNSLSLLSLQAELIDLEDQYRRSVEFDNQSDESVRKALSSGFWELRHSYSKQKTLLSDHIRPKLSEYNDLVLQLAEIAKLHKPKEGHLQSLRDWLIGPKEGRLFLQGIEFDTWNERYDRDFVTIDARPDTNARLPKWLNPKLVDLYYSWRPQRNNPRYIDPEAGRVFDTDESRVVRSCRILSKLIGTVVGSLLPALAIYALNAVNSTSTRIGMTIGFTSLFCVCLFLFTNASMKEIYTAAATFAAVEVVFIGSVVPSSPQV